MTAQSDRDRRSDYGPAQLALYGLAAIVLLLLVDPRLLETAKPASCLVLFHPPNRFPSPVAALQTA